jgi:hypothetical protein
VNAEGNASEVKLRDLKFDVRLGVLHRKLKYTMAVRHENAYPGAIGRIVDTRPSPIAPCSLADPIHRPAFQATRVFAIHNTIIVFNIADVHVAVLKLKLQSA